MADTRDTIVTALLAFAGGFVAGILLAPASGEHTRGRIASEARQGLRRLESKLDHLQSQLSGLQHSIRDAGSSVGTKVRTAGVEVGERVKDAAHHAVDSIVPGVPEDPDAFKVENGEVSKDLRHMPRR